MRLHSHSTGYTPSCGMAGIVSVIFAGARYQRNMHCQMTPQNRGYYDKVWVEQQRCMQLPAMEHPAFAPGMHQMAYSQPNLVPINAPMQHFSG